MAAERSAERVFESPLGPRDSSPATRIAVPLVAGVILFLAAWFLLAFVLGPDGALAAGVVGGVLAAFALYVVTRRAGPASGDRLLVTNGYLAILHGAGRNEVVKRRLDLDSSRAVSAVVVTAVRTARMRRGQGVSGAGGWASTQETGDLIVVSEGRTIFEISNVPDPEYVAALIRERFHSHQSLHMNQAVGAPSLPRLARLGETADHATWSDAKHDLGSPLDPHPDLSARETTPPIPEGQARSPLDSVGPTTSPAPPEAASLTKHDGDAAPVAPSDPVELGLSAPARVKPSGTFTARLVAYVEDQEPVISNLLRGLAPRTERILGVKRCRWKRGTIVTVTFRSDQIAAEVPEQQFVWNGGPEIVNFGCSVRPDAPPGDSTLRFSLSILGCVVADLCMDILIDSSAESDASETMRARQPSWTAFASYASADEDRVCDMVGALRTLAGLNVFMARADLRPNEDWEARLHEEIRQRDRFLLFWSRAARDSEWVGREWRLALRLKGKEAIQIRPLETVTQAPPPDELKDLHFDDPLIYIRMVRAQELMSHRFDTASKQPEGSGGPAAPPRP